MASSSSSHSSHAPPHAPRLRFLALGIVGSANNPIFLRQFIEPGQESLSESTLSASSSLKPLTASDPCIKFQMIFHASLDHIEDAISAKPKVVPGAAAAASAAGGVALPSPSPSGGNASSGAASSSGSSASTPGVAAGPDSFGTADGSASAASAASTGLQASFPSSSQASSTLAAFGSTASDSYLGFLFPTEDCRVYGYATNTRMKLILITDDVEPRPNEIAMAFRLIHAALVDTLSNPFQPTGEVIKSQAFVRRVAKILQTRT